MRQAFLSVALVVVSTVAANTAEARSFRVEEIPNGAKFGCRNCHNDDSGATNTPFLADVRSNLEGPGTIQEDHVVWGPALCNVDSDGDGWSNAAELGDPDCVWTIGSSPAKSSATNPGNPKSHPAPICGNGKLDAGEACDAGQQAKVDCAEESAGQGTLGCNMNDCTYNYSNCTQPPGGRGVEDGESEEDGGCTTTGGATGGGGMAVLLGLSLLLRRRRRER
ncbi:MAG: hypothetical protein JNL21_06045 [Myxococcales bacterium]|nr:hypothetical protein [Myxococcales bacterium]